MMLLPMLLLLIVHSLLLVGTTIVGVAIPHVEQLVHDAFQSIPKHDYESLAIQLIPYVHAASVVNTSRKGYLCTTFLKWSTANIDKFVHNANLSRDFCDWAIVVYNPLNTKLEEMQTLLESKLTQRIQIILAPPKSSAHQTFLRICQDLMANVQSHYQKDELLSKNISKTPCDFIYDTYPTSYNHKLYSKSELWLLLLPILRGYEYVWLLDDDLSLDDINFNQFQEIHQCSFANPPLVTQPLINVPTQFYKYLYRGAWNDRKTLASTVGFIEIQAPMFEAKFLQWFLVAFITPLYPAMHILGADWGLDELFCTAASEYLRVTSPSLPRNEVCAVVIADMQLGHENKNEIGKAIGIESKRQLNFGLMKVVHRHFGSFAHGGLQYQVNPFNNGTHFQQIYKLQDSCKFTKEKQ